MTLRVRGSDSFQAVVLSALQCLDSRITYMNVDRVELLRRINESAVVIDPTTAGGSHGTGVKTRELFRALIQCSHRIQIEQTGGGSECVPSDRSSARTGSRVKWNPAQTLPGALACCSCIYLGHELCHSHQLIRGAIHPSEFYAGRAAKMRYEMLNITGAYGRERAGPGAITENDLRREHDPRQSPRMTL
jgi:hypothetical protein